MGIGVADSEPLRRPAVLQLLPHPAFVYCARFSPVGRESCIVTGCSDNVVRVWGKAADADTFLVRSTTREPQGTGVGLGLERVENNF